MTPATGVVSRLRVPAVFVLGRGVGISTQVTCLQGGLCLPAGVVTRLYLRDPSEDMVEAQTVTDLMDHGVSVTKSAIKGRIQHNPTYKEQEAHFDVKTMTHSILSIQMYLRLSMTSADHVNS